MYASGTISMTSFSMYFFTCSYSIRSLSESSRGRRYGLILATRSPGRNPSRSPASTAGRTSTIFLTAPCRNSGTAIPTARNVLPLPARPPQMVTSFSRRATTYRPCPSVRGRRYLPPSITVRFCGLFRSDPARTTSRIVLTSSLVSWPLARSTARIWPKARSAWPAASSGPSIWTVSPRATTRTPRASRSSFRFWSRLPRRRTASSRLSRVRERETVSGMKGGSVGRRIGDGHPARPASSPILGGRGRRTRRAKKGPPRNALSDPQTLGEALVPDWKRLDYYLVLANCLEDEPCRQNCAGTGAISHTRPHTSPHTSPQRQQGRPLGPCWRCGLVRYGL